MLPTAEQGVDEMSFVENEVYAIDILVSTGEGKPKILDEKETTVYKRALDREYQLKMKTLEVEAATVRPGAV